ncbi:MAG: adenosylcobinamide-GDP ribazoletransferase, partial [Anaerolineales bacterium]|nr:adenosylcobinamide-GDP ribazoletransferase [Anaerolineales bacterium]
MVPIIAAFQFLTIFPTLIRRMFTSQEMGRAVGWFPLVGVTLGALLYGINHFAQMLFPASVSAALTVFAWVFFTRAFHLDGFMDTCDGLFGGFTPERRLEIMKDSRMGAFGVAGGVLVLLTKYAALASSSVLLPALVISATLGRWGMALAIFAFPYAREHGLGRDVKDNVCWPQIVLATCISLIVVWLAGAQMGLIAFALAGLTLWLSAS